MKEPKEIKVEYTDFMPEIIPVTTDNVQDYFMYWKSIEKLKVWKEVKWSSWGNYYIWAVTYAPADWTWSKSITWVGFKPTRIRVHAVCSWAWWWSDMYTDGTTTVCHIQWAWYNSFSSHAFYAWDWVNAAFANFTSLDADWFTINIITYTGQTAIIRYECFW